MSTFMNLDDVTTARRKGFVGCFPLLQIDEAVKAGRRARGPNRLGEEKCVAPLFKELEGNVPTTPEEFWNKVIKHCKRRDEQCRPKMETEIPLGCSGRKEEQIAHEGGRRRPNQSPAEPGLCGSLPLGSPSSDQGGGGLSVACRDQLQADGRRADRSERKDERQTRQVKVAGATVAVRG